MTIEQCARIIEHTLVQAGVPSPRMDADVLVGIALKKDRSYVLTHASDTLSLSAARRAWTLCLRRAAHEPIAYIRGSNMFYGRLFSVNRHTLIPRPETELIIEKIVQELPRSFHGTLVDVGTGSGALAITLACEFPHANLYATDISQSVLAVARKNARQHNVARRITFLQGALLSPLATHSTGFRHPLIVVANLPYVPTAVWKHSEKQVRLFEPQNAIDGGRDGLTVYRQLLRHIKKTGMLPDVVWSEIDASQGDSFPRLVQRVFPAGARTTLFHDLAGLPRLVRTVFEV